MIKKWDSLDQLSFDIDCWLEFLVWAFEEPDDDDREPGDPDYGFPDGALDDHPGHHWHDD